MDVDDVITRIDRARNELLKRDAYLLEKDANERSITHKLAEYISREFPDWDVDCEYNRDGNLPKELHMDEAKHTTLNDTNATTVYPDIIVHRRGKGGPNLLVLEAKKFGHSTAYDEEKLLAYRAHYGYEYIALAILTTGEPPDVRIALL